MIAKIAIHITTLVTFFLITTALTAEAYNPSSSSTSSSRRSLLRQVLQKSSAAVTAATLISVNPLVSVATTAAADDSSATAAAAAAVPPLEESVYFGVGCFWHLQHEFALAERDLLGRNGGTFSCLTGYAGGKGGADKEGRVCYHNLMSMADYGKLGHAEVVGMHLPSDKIADFARVYFSCFDPKTKDRVDPQDRGSEYRSLMGLPGGTSHPAYPAIQQAASDAGYRLEAGQGSDGDTLKKQLVWVYDTKDFPFYQAEVYHQFHNDFQSPAYGIAYNKLADRALEDGRIKLVGCPDRV